MTVRPDNRLRDAPMAPVRCIRCAAGVRVRKSSWNQTSVQWDAEAMAGCRERADVQRLAAYEGQGLFLACSALSESIARAVREGDVRILDETIPTST